MKKRLFTASVLATSMLWLAAAPGTAVAQDKYPSKSVRWIVPYAAGGGSDFLARTIGQAWGAQAHQPIVVDNRPGGGGQIAAGAVRQQPADGHTIFVGATSGEAAEAARQMINAIANPTMPERGERYLGTVVKLMPFGAFVSLMPGKDGLLHISKLRALAGGKRVEDPEDVLSVGQKLQVEISEIDDRGKLSLVPVVEETEAAAE